MKLGMAGTWARIQPSASCAPVGETVAALTPHLSKDDILIDGSDSNSNQFGGHAIKAAAKK
jgi:6-phosphogluconate dehydrogenase